MLINAFLVAIGGFFGAVVRYAISILVKNKLSPSFPIATLFVNLTGSFLLGYIYGMGTSGPLTLLFGTGFLGAYTTFSTFKLENVQLIEKRNWKFLMIYLGVSYSLGILLAFLGMKLGGI
ncbi:fluoride efflux transporter CrcB [Heyndrickxia sp. NPDC080065]|uniref:fluoride efflux transporter CrcB n=1 Tax=Heyndrickxia sp. NPDC080065 TaxID=3390568 RepID=UPI003D07C656